MSHHTVFLEILIGSEKSSFVVQNLLLLACFRFATLATNSNIFSYMRTDDRKPQLRIRGGGSGPIFLYVPHAFTCVFTFRKRGVGVGWWVEKIAMRFAVVGPHI